MSITWIEASAGTGKTYTLVQTVLRLVVDEGLPVERILMVTFTEKATAELKTRIRLGLREAWKKTGDPRLSQALEDLASLSVTTIHGFCRTLLTQFPLESGVSFEPEMVDQGRQWRRLLRDELRPRLADLDGNLLAWAGLEQEEDLLSLAREALDRNLFSLPTLHPTEGERETFGRWRAELEAGTGPLWTAVEGLKGLSLPEDALGAFGPLFDTHLHGRNHKAAYQTVRSLVGVKTFRDWLPLLTADLPQVLARWDEGGSVWKGKAKPPFEGTLEQVRTGALAVLAALEAHASALPEGVGVGTFLRGTARYQILEDLCRPVLGRRSSRELTFHDLIERVRDLATSPGGSALAEGAGQRWKAVLIDEFQDTDPGQWEIFRSLFGGPQHQLFLVGDPKQSIYRFRGADLDVYRAVRDQVTASGATTLVLDENYRSTAAMVEAVNCLFHPSRAPWDHPDDFQPSKKGNKPIGQLVRQDADGNTVPLPPLAVYRGTDIRGWHRFLVQTVVELLDGHHCLDDGQTQHPLTPGDFLILVRKKQEAWTLYRLLTARGIPATVGGSGGLLRGREAEEILLFLKALENPRSLPVARALAWTRLFQGADPEDLMPALDEAREDRDRGAFLRAFRRVVAATEPGVPDGGGLEGLLRLPGGPRIVTNAEHVLEMVQERYHRGDVPPGQVALSLETWMASGLQEDEVDLRRAGESPTLRLMTVHAAKGLESPVVLHGFPSDPPADRSPWIIAGGVDFLKTAASRAAEERNRQAEDLRLRYVALTRARTHQVFVDPTWEDSRAVPLSPSAGTLPQATPPPLLAPTPVPDLLPPLVGLEHRHPWVESHSGLWRRATRAEFSEKTVWDRPLRPREDEPEAALDRVDDLPAGPVFGDLVHDLLEKADFRGWAPDAPPAWRQEAERLTEELALRQRSAFQGRDLSRVLFPWVGKTLNHPFFLNDASDPLVFSTLDPEDTRKELEFHLPLAPGAPRHFDWGGRFFTVRPGFLTGRIDLLFRWGGKLYLADWKTNRLAPGQDPQEVMAEAGYDLQAQWYWEALNRLVPLHGGLEPGGVLYLFLRGGEGQPQGVFLSPPVLAAKTTLTPYFLEVSRG